MHHNKPNIIYLFWWLVNIGSGNGLGPSGNKLFFIWASVNPDLCHHMVSLDHNELTLYYLHFFEEI